MPEKRLQRTRDAYYAPQYSRADIDRMLRIKAVYQLQGGSDSGGIYWQSLNVRDVRHTREGLVIEVE